MTKNVFKNVCMDKLIETLNTLYKHDSISTIQDRLRNLKDGASLDDEEVDDIFKPIQEDWAFHSSHDDNKWCVKAICSLIKKNMFRHITS